MKAKLLQDRGALRCPAVGNTLIDIAAFTAEAECQNKAAAADIVC